MQFRRGEQGRELTQLPVGVTSSKSIPAVPAGKRLEV